MIKFQQYIEEDKAGKSLADKSKKSGISVGTLRKVYNRGVAAWKTGHRPGTTPHNGACKSEFVCYKIIRYMG